MNFFRLHTPNYATDQAMRRANPIEPRPASTIPGMICSACHETWGGFHETFIRVPENFLDTRLQDPWPILESEWSVLVADVRSALGLSLDVELRPGDRLGIPDYFVKPTDSDFLFYLGSPFVSQRVSEALINATITGPEPIAARLTWHPRVKDKAGPLPSLYGLKIHGRGWREGMDLDTITVCSHCKRRVFPNPNTLVIDTDRWDGSDMFILDLNSGYVIVTERVGDLFSANGFTNYRLTPIASI